MCKELILFFFQILTIVPPCATGYIKKVNYALPSFFTCPKTWHVWNREIVASKKEARIRPGYEKKSNNCNPFH